MDRARAAIHAYPMGICEMYITHAYLRSQRLPLLQEAIAKRNKQSSQKWGVFLLKEYNANPTGSAIMVSEILLMTSDRSTENSDLCIVSTQDIGELKFCIECARLGTLTKLGNSNKSGYCAKHSNQVPSRKKLINAQRKPNYSQSLSEDRKASKEILCEMLESV